MQLLMMLCGRVVSLLMVPAVAQGSKSSWCIPRDERPFAQYQDEEQHVSDA